MRLVEDKLGLFPHKRGSTEEALAVHNAQLRDQHRRVKGMLPGDEGSVVRTVKIRIGDEVRASFRVKGNKVKEVTSYRFRDFKEWIRKATHL
tara:strand:- start:355 stop:630 length:276 start_codon:yes stop_codon:yes gene_type:complete